MRENQFLKNLITIARDPLIITELNNFVDSYYTSKITLFESATVEAQKKFVYGISKTKFKDKILRDVMNN